jgi:myo-inositol-1(or 4)-monophosphatase
VADPTELVDLARDVAREAAELAAEKRRAGVWVTGTKTSTIDVVTEADEAVERLVRGRLLDARPGDGFVGEEGGSTGSDTGSETGVTWVVDPIDGTVNYLYGIPHYAVSVAAKVAGEVLAGVVVDVEKGECFTATRGGGAFLDGGPIRVRDRVALDQRLVATGFNYVRDVRVAQAAAAAVLLPQVRDIRRLGSAALDLCALAAGRLDGYVEEGLNEWDLAAGGLVAEEAGATVVVRPGAGGGDCVVAAPADGFEELLEVVGAAGFLRE